MSDTILSRHFTSTDAPNKDRHCRISRLLSVPGLSSSSYSSIAHAGLIAELSECVTTIFSLWLAAEPEQSAAAAATNAAADGADQSPAEPAPAMDPLAVTAASQPPDSRNRAEAGRLNLAVEHGGTTDVTEPAGIAARIDAQALTPWRCCRQAPAK